MSQKAKGGSSLFDYVNSQFDPSLQWADLEWLKGITKLPIIVKGILTAEDALLAVEAGASAIMVSNHGGRQLEGAPATVSSFQCFLLFSKEMVAVVMKRFIQYFEVLNV